MKQTITGPSMPMAAICINKSRLKIYHKEKTPTFYLEKDQEFQIELFNPTTDTILAKIQLNGNQISQGGLVLRPGERVFLERYLDVARKFKFDTYKVSNTAEVQKAIEDNGDFKVEFYRESRPIYLYDSSITISSDPITRTNIDYNSTGNPNPSLRSFGTTSAGNTFNTTGMLNASNSTSSYFSNSSLAAGASSYTSDVPVMDSLSLSDEVATPMKSLRSRSKKNIETGRVEAGSSSSQKLEYVSKSFDYWPFHTLEYKLLPISQKINSTDDINVKRYCHHCGAKQKPEFKFCPSCGTKA
jgi:hypothetical protein